VSIRVGVIGVGYLGQHHARVFSGLDGVDLVGVAGIDSRIRRNSRQIQLQFFSSYTDLIEACDVLSIVTPTTTHHAIGMDCLKAGKDLFIEKPITERLDEAKELIDAAEKDNLILQVGHLERYNPGIIAAREMVSDPIFVEAERLSPFLGRALMSM
jgi:predicted dehydrogenase